MSEYQKLKARAQAAQQAREREVQLELEAKAEKEKQKRREEDERRKRQEAESRAARTLELKKANEAINKGKQTGNGLEYDPFAEEERRPTPAVPSNPHSAKAKSAVGKTSSTGGSASRQTTLKQDIPRPPLHNSGSRSASGSGSKPRVNKEASPPALGRKEQAARAMIASMKKSAGATSVFSVRPPASSSNGISKIGSSSSAPLRAPPSKGVPMKQTTLGKKGKHRPAESELRALCPDRGSRDQRTMDEIQRDIKARKGVPSTSTSSSRSPVPDRNRIAPPPTKSRPSSNKPPARRRSPSTSSSASSSSSDLPARKRPRPGEGGSSNKPNISSMIQDIFRRPGRPAPAARYDSDSDGSDMEAGYSDVEEEERRAVRIARREDELAEKEERERKEKKERLRKERERAGAK